MTEPMPGGGGPPFVSEAVQRLWDRLPRVYRHLDSQQGWALKRFLGGVLVDLGTIDDMVERLRGSRPVGPSSPEPWDLSDEDLAAWRAARTDTNSALCDPDLADAGWLPWLAQMLGVLLDPQSGLAERRDTIRFATSGYRGGTRAALADAARPALTGSRYVDVLPFMNGNVAGGQWDVTVRTRPTETPDQSAIIPTILRQGAKPAGVVLHVGSFGSPWDVVEARYPTWTNWEGSSWDHVEEIAVTYASVAENLTVNPSFEGNVTGWSALVEGGGSTPTFTLAAGAGVDGADAGRLTKVGAVGGMAVQSTAVIVDARILPARDYIFACSVKPSAAIAMTLQIDWKTSGGAVISSTTQAMGTLNANAWNRTNTTSRHTSPATSAQARLVIRFTGTISAAVTADLDAVLFRLITAAGG